MTTGWYYREEARRCRVRATREPDSSSSARWLQLAREYELLADDLEESTPSAPNDPHVHLQGAQQHHAKEDGPEARRRTVREPDPALNGCAGKTPASD